MKTTFSLLLALVIAAWMSVMQAQAQPNFTVVAGGAWTTPATWTPGGIPVATGGFPGAAPGDNGTAIIGAAATFTGTAPGFNVTSLQMSGAVVFNMTGAMNVSGGLTISTGSLNIQQGTVIINGPVFLGAGTNITVQPGAILTLNSTLTGTGTVIGSSGGNGSTINLGPAFNTGILPSANFANPFNGYLNTGGALALNGNFATANNANSVLNLVGQLTINTGFALTLGGTSAALGGSGFVQGQSGTSSLILGASFNTAVTPNPNLIPGTNIASPFNGRLITNSNLSFNSPLTISATGGLTLNAAGTTLSPSAAVNTLTLNNTGVSSALGPGTIHGVLGGTVTLGPGFNGGILQGSLFSSGAVGNSSMAGTLVTQSALSLASNFNLPLGPPAGTLSLGGVLTIGTGISLGVQNTATAITGSSIQAVASAVPFVNGVAGTLALAAMANNGNIPATSIVNPFSGVLTTNGAMALTTSLTMGAPSVLNLQGAGNLTLGGSAILTLGQTNNLTTGIQGAATNLIVPAAGTTVSVASGAFIGFVPQGRFGTPATTFPAGTLVLNGAASLDPASAGGLIMANNTVLSLASTPGVPTLVVPTGQSLDMQSTAAGALVGAGTINGNGPTSSVQLVNGFNGGTIFGNNFFNPFNGSFVTSGAIGLTQSLVMGANSILSLAGDLTVLANSGISLNMTNPAAGSFLGTGNIVTPATAGPAPAAATVSLGSGALMGVFPNTRIPTGTAVTQFGGIVSVGQGVSFQTSYTVAVPAVLNLVGTSINVAAGASLGLQNTAVNAIRGTGTLQGFNSSATVAMASGFNGGLLPGVNFVNPFGGSLQTQGPMSLTSNLTMDLGSVLSLGGSLSLNPGVNLGLNGTATGALQIPGGNGIVGPVGSSVSVGAGANGGNVPLSVLQVPLGPATPTQQFLGTLTLAAGLNLQGSCGTPASSSPYQGTLNLLGTVTIPTSCAVSLANQSANAIIGTGAIQGTDATSILWLGQSFNTSQVPGTRLANQFNGRLITFSPMSLPSNLTMGTGSILDMGGDLLVSNGVSLTLNGTSSTALTGVGRVNGQSAAASVTLGPNAAAGVVPVANLAGPFNGRLIISAPMTLNNAFTIGPAGGFQLNGNLLISSSAPLGLNGQGAGTLGGSAVFVAAAATSQVQLGPGVNAGVLPSSLFGGYNGVVSVAGAMSLSGDLTLGATGVVSFAGGQITLGNNNASMSNSQGGSQSSFFVTNGTGSVTLTSTTLNPYVFHIGTTATAYSPVTLVNNGAADTFTARVAPGITNRSADYPDRINLEWSLRQGSSAGTKNAQITFQWNSFDRRGRFDSSQVGVAYWGGTDYLIGPRGQATAAPNPGIFSRSTTVTVALAGTGTNTPLPFVVLTIIPPPTPPTTPQITAFDPTSILSSVADTTIFVRGFNFLPGARVTISYPSLSMGTVSFRASTSNVFSGVMTVTIPGYARAAGRDLTFTVSNNNGSTDAVAVFPVRRAVAPTITSVMPSVTAATGQAFTAIINGTNFFTNYSFVTVEDTVRGLRFNAIPRGSTTATQAFIEIPSIFNVTTSATIIRFTNPDGQVATTSIQTQGGAAQPVITFLQPSSTTAGVSGLELTINGVNFFNDVTVRFSNQSLPIIFKSPSKLIVQIPGSLLTTPGLPALTVQNADNSQVGTRFIIAPAVPPGAKPEITSYTPVSTTASFRAFNVVLNGRNFSRDGVVSVPFVSDQTIVPSAIVIDTNRVVVTIPALNTSATISVGITNPDGQATSATVTVGRPLPAPVLNSFSPPATTASVSREFTIAISGSNFTQGATAVLNDPVRGISVPLVVSFNRSDSVRVVVPDSLNRNSNVTITILNVDGQFIRIPYSLMVTSIRLPNPLVGVSAFPNPVADELTVQTEFERPQSIQITVSSVLGQRVMSLSEYVPAGAYRKALNLSGLSTGTYLLEVSDGSRRYVEQIVKY